MSFLARRALAPVVAVLVAAGALFALSAPGTAVTSDEAAMASLVNGARAAAGLPPLVVSGSLSDAARSHSASMAASGTLFHSGGLATGDWVATGENVGVGATVAEVHNAFMGSGTHRANILGDFNVLGVGIVRGSDGRLWITEEFVKQAVAPTPAPEPTTTTTVPVTDPTTVTVAAAAPAPAKVQHVPSRPAKVRAARAQRPARRAPVARVQESGSGCLPEQAQPQGQGHAYGRCDEVPRGAAAGGRR